MANSDDTVTPFTSAPTSLLHFDGANGSTTLIDATGNHTWTVDLTAQLDTSKSKFGPSSLHLANAGYDRVLGDGTLVVGTSDFTLDFWLWLDGTQAGQTNLVNFVTNNGPIIYIASPGGPLLLYVSGVAITGTTNVTTSAWHHIALTRTAGNHYLFLDGHLEGTWASGSVDYGTVLAQYPVIGQGGAYSPVGWYDEFRITIGTADWTANFTPPTAPYLPADPVAGITGTLAITQGAQTLSAVGNVPVPKTFWILNTAATSPDWGGNLQDGGSAPTAVLSSYGWTVAKTATTTPYWRARLGASATATTAAATSYIDGTTGPTAGTAATNTTAGDSFASTTTYSGIFAAGNWNLSFGMRTAIATTVGRIRCRIWASVNANGSSARELTSGAQACSIVTMSTTTTTYTSSATWAAPQIILNNEYLFFQVEWQETTAGTQTTCTAQFYVSAASIGTSGFSPSLLGTLAVTEAGDTLSATGNIPVITTGTLAIVETPDTLSAAGGPRVGGTLSVTQANQTLSATGLAAVLGTLAITQGAETLSAAGNVPQPGITGTLAITQAAQTISATGAPAAVGTLTVTQAAQTLSAVGRVTVGGTLTVTQANQTLSATGAAILVGNLTATQAAQTLIAAGGPVVGGHLTATQANETLSAAGTVAIGGTLTVTQASETLSAAGGPRVGGTLTQTQAAQTLSGGGTVLSGIVGSLGIVQANQTLSAAGNVPFVISGTLVVTQAAQTLSAGGTVIPVATGTLSLTQANNTLAATGTIPIGAITGTLVLTQANQALSAAGNIPSLGVEPMHTLSHGNLYVAGVIKTAAVPVSGLPHPGRAGTRNFVTDATFPLRIGVGNIVTGGGSNKVPVYDDGANWRIG